MKRFVGVLFVLALIQGCERNYQKELEKTVLEYQKQGTKVIVAVSENKHFIIYRDRIYRDRDDNILFINDLDNPVHPLLPDSVNCTEWGMDFDENGVPYIGRKESKIAVDANFGNLKLIRDTILFLGTEYNGYVSFLNMPDRVHTVNSEWRRPEMLQGTISATLNQLIDKTNRIVPAEYLDEYERYNERTEFQWNFFIDEKNTFNPVEQILCRIEFWRGSIDSLYFDVSDFSTKEGVQYVLERIYDSYKEETKRQELERIKEESVTIKELMKIFGENPIKAKEKYIGKYVIVRCNLETIKEREKDVWDVLFGVEGPTEYELRSYASEQFGVWWDGYNIIGYTKDIKFVEEISYPHEVIMKAKVISRINHGFEFKDCELLAW